MDLLSLFGEVEDVATLDVYGYKKIFSSFLYLF